MIYSYARVSTDGQSVEAQAYQLMAAGCEKIFREVASGAKTDRVQLRRLVNGLMPNDVVMVTRLDRLARSTRDLLNTLATIATREAGFRSLGDTWADTTTPHGRVLLTVLAAWPNSSASSSWFAPARAGPGEGPGRENGPQAKVDTASAKRGYGPDRGERGDVRH